MVEAFDENNQTNGTFETRMEFFYPKKSVQVNGWLEFVVEGLQPFQIVENKSITRHVRYAPITVKTLKKYMEKLSQRVENKISNMLPDKFVVVFDCWTNGDTHYLAMYGSFPNSTELGHEQCLLAFTPFEDETSQGCSNHLELFRFVLNVFKKSEKNVVALVGDNCSTNIALAREFDLGFVGCASHRYNLAVKYLLKPHMAIVKKIHAIMSKFRYPIPAAKLRKLTPLKAKTYVETRWSSAVEMLRRYALLRDFFPRIDLEGLDEMLLTVSGNKIVDKLCSQFSDLNSITKGLQSNSVTISEVRAYFDEVIDMYPEAHARLSSRASIVKQPDFESALLKLQEGNAGQLSFIEKQSVECLMQNINGYDTADEVSTTIAERALKKRKINKGSSTRYEDCRFILPTSNLCERLFSTARHALPERRKSMLPYNFEMQLFLHANKHIWDMSDVNAVVQNTS